MSREVETDDGSCASCGEAKVDGNKLTTMSCCAFCGIAEIDDIKLKDCDNCDLEKYCCDDCQELHRPEHEDACKKRAAELRDDLLFQQPDSSHLGDCPICLFPLSFDVTKNTMWPCCSKLICNGCNLANQEREHEMRLQHTCPFCRRLLNKTDTAIKLHRQRAEANDPLALERVGERCLQEGDYEGAFECWTKAAQLGEVEAHYQLSVVYQLGWGVEKDEKKEVNHLETAAIAGHPEARHNLGVTEIQNGRRERAVKHWMIAANLGCDDSLDALKQCCQKGIISKEDFAAALRAYQAAVNATKSPQRDVAEARMGKMMGLKF